MIPAPTMTARRPAPTREGAGASGWLHDVATGPAREFEVVGVHRAAAHLRTGGDLIVTVEHVDGLRLPNAVALDPTGPGLAGFTAGATGRIGGGTMRVGDRAIWLRRWWDPRPALAPPGPDRLRAHRDALPSTIPTTYRRFGLHGPVADLWCAARDEDSGDPRRLVDALIGRGPGSTPAGDDVVAGLLAALRVLAHRPVEFATALAGATRHAAHRTTALSATLLRCAADGAVVGPARGLLAAIARPAPIGDHVAALRRVGHTSGADLLLGMAIAVDLLIGGRPHR